MSGTRNIPVRPYFGGFILETLTVGMYEESRNAIREYVQNGFDSIQRATHELKQLAPGDGEIKVTFDADSNGVSIRDNGAGLPARLAGQTLTSVGASRKDFRSDAGFRGIGRLSGIVFSDTVVFRTKAAGEAEETEVRFNAARMRELMAPGKGSELTAEQLLIECVEIKVHAVTAHAPSYFQVTLRGFNEAPDECRQPDLMARFLSQVAPVPFRDDFAYRSKIHEYGRGCGIPVDEVAVTILTADGRSISLTKPYAASYEVQGYGIIPLAEVQYFKSPTNRWWGWLGKKEEPGSYLEDAVRGVRVRAKNIQIDGEGVVRSIFQKRRASTARYQDWFLGEIHVDLKAVTPNARRDGFEETTGWKAVQREVANSICDEAGRSAQSISNAGQLTLQKLSEKTKRAEENLAAQRQAGFTNTDRVIALSAEVTGIYKDVARASRNADSSTQAELNHLSSLLSDLKVEALGRLTSKQPELDRETLEQETRQLLLAELMVLFEEQLDAPCLAVVRNLIREEYGFPPG